MLFPVWSLLKGVKHFSFAGTPLGIPPSGRSSDLVFTATLVPLITAGHPRHLPPGATVRIPQWCHGAYCPLGLELELGGDSGGLAALGVQHHMSEGARGSQTPPFSLEDQPWVLPSRALGHYREARDDRGLEAAS